jgi:hypothetical protein
MAFEGFKDARELVMAHDVEETFKAGFDIIKKTCLKAGFDKAAVDSLQFKVSEHTLTISDEESSKGAFHVHGDGKPFYVLSVAAPGSMSDMASGDSSIPPTKRSPHLQAILLAMEIGVNILPRMGEILADFYGQKNADGKLVAGGSMSYEQIKCETTLRCDPLIYCRALNDMVALRLKQVAPAPAVPTAKAPGFKS